MTPESKCLKINKPNSREQEGAPSMLGHWEDFKSNFPESVRVGFEGQRINKELFNFVKELFDIINRYNSAEKNKSVSYSDPKLTSVDAIKLFLVNKYFSGQREHDSLGLDFLQNAMEEIKRMERSIYYDRLTGLPNRKSLELDVRRVVGKYLGDSVVSQEQSERRQEKARAEVVPEFSVVFFDLDSFGIINDKVGNHSTGNAVLIAFAKILKRNVRSLDTVCRYGGEEIVLLLPNTDGSGAVIVAEKIRKDVEENLVSEANAVIASMQAEDSRLELIDTKKLNRFTSKEFISVSGGVAPVSRTDQGSLEDVFNSVLHKADCALVGTAKREKNTIAAWKVTNAVTEIPSRKDVEPEKQETITKPQVLEKLSKMIDDNNTVIGVLLREQANKLSDADLISLYQHLEFVTRASIEDSLTALINKEGYERMMEKAFSEAKRHGTPFSLLVMDVDLFKSVNEIYGHATGDKVLQALGAVLKRRCRSGEIACRLGAGSEEFMVILNDTNAEHAKQAGEAFRRYIQVELIIEYNKIKDQNDPQIQTDRPILTVSIGIASVEPTKYTAVDKRDRYKLGVDSPEQIFGFADTALGSCKQGVSTNGISKDDINRETDNSKRIPMVQELLENTRNRCAFYDAKTNTVIPIDPVED